MKIIARADGDKYICEVSIKELANINGFDSEFSAGCDRIKMTAINSVIEVENIYRLSKFVRTMRTSVLKKCQAEIDTASGLINSAIVNLGKLDLFEILAED